MKKGARNQNILVQLNKEELKLVDDFVKKFSGSRSQIMRMAFNYFVAEQNGKSTN